MPVFDDEIQPNSNKITELQDSMHHILGDSVFIACLRGGPESRHEGHILPSVLILLPNKTQATWEQVQLLCPNAHPTGLREQKMFGGKYNLLDFKRIIMKMKNWHCVSSSSGICPTCRST